MREDDLGLEPFARHHLPRLSAWFDDSETQRRLGGRQWPADALLMLDEPVRETRHGAAPSSPRARAGFAVRRQG